MKNDPPRNPFTSTVVLEEELPRTVPAPQMMGPQPAQSLTATVVLQGTNASAPTRTVPIGAIHRSVHATAVLDPADEKRQTPALSRAERPEAMDAAGPTSTGAPFPIAKPDGSAASSPREAPWREPQLKVQPASDTLVGTVMSIESHLEAARRAATPVAIETPKQEHALEAQRATAPKAPVYGALLPKEEVADTPPPFAPKPVARVAERKAVGPTVYSNFKKR